ncbi:uncharacterized protein LOC62_02G002492 [Vanrija pseudolonga]|uniref:Uncharacterized protein n=1 Tax=Vanrija pseudolonga TaxID=143232 RepID=A0AAF0Y2M0_9TREE|nr:hypothetical protein LOC62_02G002492 [Vanrija pseudolonga]
MADDDPAPPAALEEEALTDGPESADTGQPSEDDQTDDEAQSNDDESDEDGSYIAHEDDQYDEWEPYPPVVSDDEARKDGFKVNRPGFDLPVLTHLFDDDHFKLPAPTIGWSSNTPTLRERTMLWYMNKITDEPGWEVRVLDDALVEQWRAEVRTLPASDNGPPFTIGFTDRMFDWCIRELRDKAVLFKKTGYVGVLDCAAAVCKMDDDDELRHEVKSAIAKLEDDEFKDWREGTNGQVLDLVDPNLWSLCFGRTRVLPDREIGISDCLDNFGSGEVAPVPKHHQVSYTDYVCYADQWLPAEVTIDGEGKATFTSYINNLHPVDHADAYRALEHVLDRASPMLGEVYDRHVKWHIHVHGEEDDEDDEDDEDGGDDDGDGDGGSGDGEGDGAADTVDDDARQNPAAWSRIVYAQDDFTCEAPDICGNRGECSVYDTNDTYDDNRLAWYKKTHPTTQPEPREEYKFVGAGDGRPDAFHDEHMQVVVKVSNIYLTPENPSYAGEEWQIDGTLNEMVYATAVYYYDDENIADDSHLEFRTTVDKEMYGHNDGGYTSKNDLYYNFEEVYGIADASASDEPKVFEMGSVATREGRIIVYPNVMVHRASPIKLADPTKPGHRKTVTFYVLDLNRPVVSTANVPPQQLHWWLPRPALDGRLPPELAGMVRDEVGCPYDRDQATALRREFAARRAELSAELGVNKSGESWDYLRV